MSYREEPKHLKGLKWYQPRIHSKLEEYAVIFGIVVSIMCSVLLILSLFI